MANDMNVRKARASVKVMRSIGVGITRPHLAVGADGSTPMVITLPNEYAGEVFARVRAIGGPVNVIIAFTDSYKVMCFNEPSAKSHGDLVINEDLSMGMLDLRMQKHPGKTLRLMFAEADVEAPMQSEFAYA